MATQAYFTEYVSCAKCGKVVKGPCMIGGGSQWHPMCYRCDHCNTPIQKEFRIKISVVGGENRSIPHCVHCYESLFLPLCIACKLRVQEREYKESNGAIFHVRCYRCAACSKGFGPEDRPSMSNDKLYCPGHLPQK